MLRIHDQTLTSKGVSLVVFTLETETCLQNPSKLRGKLRDKVRRIIRPKKGLRFHINSDYLSDTNYPTDNPPATDNPSLVGKRPLKFDGLSHATALHKLGITCFPNFRTGMRSAMSRKMAAFWGSIKCLTSRSDNG